MAIKAGLFKNTTYIIRADNGMELSITEETARGMYETLRKEFDKGAEEHIQLVNNLVEENQRLIRSKDIAVGEAYDEGYEDAKKWFEKHGEFKN